MAITFQVYDVARATLPLTEFAPRRALHELLGGPVEACGSDRDTLVPVGQHALLVAAWRAFAEHRPLVLGPDSVWLCVAQGFAAHVNLHAEQLRERFVRHQGREQLTVPRDDFVKGSPDNPWPEVFASFSDQIAEHIGHLRDLVVCDFSTTGPIERAASEIVLMDAMQQYFACGMDTVCGIPEVTLMGTVEDWQSVRRRARMLAEFELGWWTATLLPILDEFVAAAGGRPDVAFWRHLFKYRAEGEGSGGETFIHGWILLLFPYLTGDGPGEPMRVNPILAHARGRSPVQPGGGAADWVYQSRIPPGGVPLGLSRAPMVWVYLGHTYSMDLIGGFVGIAQDPETLALRPAIGWAVRDAGDAVRVIEDEESVPEPTVPVAPATVFLPAAESFPDLVLEPVRCSRVETPEGRLILSFAGLRFIPTDAPDSAPGNLDLPRAMLTDLSVLDPELDEVELVVTLPDGERLGFAFSNDRPFALHAWCEVMRGR